MNRIIFTATLAGALLVAATTFAQAPAGAPAGTNGICKDGTYSTAPKKSGACSGHKGVQTWYAAAPAAAASAPAASAPVAAAPAPAAPTAAAPMAKPAHPAYMPPAVAAPGGGASQVWVNKSSKVYHCESDKWYGKTKNGAYMSESDAKSQGFHAEHGKACTA